MRWIILALASTLMFANFYTYDLPAALNTPLEDWLGSSPKDYQYQINMFYSVYSLPNLFLPLIGGHFVDKFGTRKLTVLLSGFQLVGSIFFSIGTMHRNVGVMIFGRLLFGLGGESLTVAQSRVTSSYFRGRELAFALGFNLAIARMGSVANDLISPAIALRFSVPAAVWVGSVTTFISFLCAIALGWLDWRITKSKYQTSSMQELQGLSTHDKQLRSHAIISPMSANAPIATSALPNAQQFHDPDGLIEEEVVSCQEIRMFPVQFWLLCLICIVMYATVVPFNTIHSAFLQTKWYKSDPQTASQIMAVPDVISAVFVPVVGTFTDNYGHRCKTLIACGILMGSVHLMLGLANPPAFIRSPVPLLVLLGFAYSLLLTFWSGIPITVGAKRQGSAFGISTAALNFSLFLFPLIVASLINADPTYFSTEMFFCTFSFLGSALALILMQVDRQKTGGILEMPEAHAFNQNIPLTQDMIPLTQEFNAEEDVFNSDEL
jgi:MFS family permease